MIHWIQWQLQVDSRALIHVLQTDSLDEDKSGLVSMDEFCKLFEPTIVRRSSSAGTMDIDDLMKEVREGAPNSGSQYRSAAQNPLSFDARIP